ncbi:MAG: nucleotidyltransferase domain-containing protein [Nitrospirae bacterium]|nr:nucleotidyltransferase domain-containing protein [Nitrospirota bacterium]
MSEEVIIKIVLSFYPDVEAIYVFGSYLTPDERNESDVDIALLFSHDQTKLLKNLGVSDCRYALEDALKKTVDLVNIRTANTVFQHTIIQEGRIIYKKSEYSVDDFEMHVMSSYQKLNEERAEILEDILETGRIVQ